MRVPRADLTLRLVTPHPRARVEREERHRYLPGPVVRPVDRLILERLRQQAGRRRPAG